MITIRVPSGMDIYAVQAPSPSVSGFLACALVSSHPFTVSYTLGKESHKLDVTTGQLVYSVVELVPDGVLLEIESGEVRA